MHSDSDAATAIARDTVPPLDDAALYCNRELSLLAFQKRVLEEARDPANPLLERINFLSIFGSNIDEMFMVRVAVLKQKIASGVHDAGIDGLSGTELLEAIRSEVSSTVREAYAACSEEYPPGADRGWDPAARLRGARTTKLGPP